jgi:tRNA (mo5U34)-methyltransferase
MNAEERLRGRALELRWFHDLDLGGGLRTGGETPLGRLQGLADIYFRDGVEGKTVLDIGCWDGFHSFEASRRGARDVLATDHFAWHASECWGDRECFDIGRALLAPEVRVEELDVPDLTPERIGRFDVVLFAGVLYHVRDPFAALQQVASVAGESLIVETHLDADDVGRPAMIFYPGNVLAGDYTNWWGPNRACVEAMLQEVGFPHVTFTEHPFDSHCRGIFHARR